VSLAEIERTATIYEEILARYFLQR